MNIIGLADDNYKSYLSYIYKQCILHFYIHLHPTTEQFTLHNIIAGKSYSRSSRVPCISYSDSEDEYLDALNEEEIDFGIGLEKLSLGPKKKLLAIDLNGVLMSKIYCGNLKEVPDSSNPARRIGNFLIYKRPFCDEFLKFCFERFEVGLWSSALQHNVDGALTYVMGSLRTKLLFVWDQSNCTDTGFKCCNHPGKSKQLFIKELKMIWNNVKKGSYTSKNTILIDNHPEKALLNPPYTGIFPVSYDGASNEVDNFLDPKGEFGKYLEGLAEADDGQSYVKKNPFGQPAISSSHPDWDFYSVVLSCLNGN